MSLTTHNVKKFNSEEVAYVYYTLPDLTLITKWSTQAMPLLLEVTAFLEQAKLASEKAYNEKIALEIRVEKLSSEKSEAMASIDKQEDAIIKITKELEEANALTKSTSFDTNSDAAEELRDAKRIIEKLEATLSEATTKMEQAGEHFKSQIEQSNNEVNQAREAEAEIREEMIKLKETNKRLVSFSSASSTTSSTKQSAHQIQADKLDETFKRVMSILDACPYPGKEKVLLASNALRGFALQDYLIRERAEGKDTWLSFIKYMRTKYTPPNHNLIIRERMKSLHQVTSVKDYYMDFRMLSVQTDDMTDATKLGMFLDNLKPELSSYCYLNQVKTLDEAYNKALLKETYCADKESTVNTASVYFTNQSSTRPETHLPLKAKNNNRYRTEICCICQQVGHIGEHCRN